MPALQRKPDGNVNYTALRRHLAIAGLALAALVVTAGLVVLVVLIFAPGQWRAYTDGIEVYQRAGETVIRNVVWQDPKRLAGSVNLKVDNYEPTMTSDGRMMIFTRWRASKNADLFVTHWDGNEWSTPTPLSELNTPAAELGPEISRDGNYLYFYSNRPGGRGGYDIWLSRRHGRRWSQPVNLGTEVNSEFNEYGPGLSPDGGMLFFSSNRPKRELTEDERERWRATLREEDLATDYDIYVANVFFDKADLEKAAKQREKARPATGPATGAATATAPAIAATRPAAEVAALPPRPNFSEARAVNELNSPGYDGQVAFTPRGDFIYFSSNRRGGHGGFDIYRTRLLHGGFLPPENVGPPVNTETNEMDPTLSVYGYWLVFSSNRDQADAKQYLLYETITREVMAVSDLAGLYALLAFLDNIKWWLLAVLLGALALAYLIYTIFGAKSPQRSLLATCILLSVLAHVVLLMLTGIWMITIELKRTTGFNVMDISVDADALASEKLALEIREQVADLEIAKDAMALGRQEDFDAQKIEPITTPPATSLDAAFQIDPADLEVMVKPTEAEPPPDLSQASDVKQIEPVGFAVAEMKFKTRPQRQSRAEPETEDVVPDPIRAKRLVQREPRVAPKVGAPMRPAAEPEAQVRHDADFEAPEVTPRAEPAARADTDVSPMKLQKLKLQAASLTFETAPKWRGREADPGDEPLKDAGGVAAMAKLAARKPAPQKRAAGPVATSMPATHTKAVGAPEAARQAKLDAPSGAHVTPVEVQKLKLQAADVTFEGSPKARRKAEDAADEPLGDIGSVAAMAKQQAPKSAPQPDAAVPVAGLLSELAMQVLRVPGKMRSAWRSPEVGRLTGAGRTIVRQTPKLKIKGPGRVEAREASVSPHLLRDPKLRGGLLKGLGGSKKTEAAVARALDWFTKHQEKDGHWSSRKHGGQAKHDMAATTFAMLCYFGWGAKHTEKGPYQKPVAKAVKWVLANAKPNGDLTGGASNGMYDQGIATMALAEAYALTKDPALKEPLKKAVALIVKAQSKQHGGWRYRPNSRDGDTSVFGWQVMALMSAHMAGFEVPEESWKLSGHWLNRVGGGKHGGLYGYQNKSPKPAMVAEGMFCQQILGLPPQHERMQESAAYLKTAPPSARGKHFYYWYYGCLALYQHRGPVWETWNEQMKQVLLQSQVGKGQHAGSWTPQGEYAGQSGRVVTTAMATLCLEVYYRFLPMYRSMRPEPPKDKLEPKGKSKAKRSAKRR